MVTQHGTDSMPKWSRPIRVPEDIGIEHAQPAYAIAGETSTWRLPFVLSRDVPSGSTLMLQVFGGRNNKGRFACKALTAQLARIAHTSPEEKFHSAAIAGQNRFARSRSVSTRHRPVKPVSTHTDDTLNRFCSKNCDQCGLAGGVALNIRPYEPSGTYAVSIPAAGLKKDDELTVTLLDCKAPRIRQLNKFFILYVAPNADTTQSSPQWAGGSVWANGSKDRIIAVCTMHILGGKIDHMRAYVPSNTKPGEQLSILIRPEDAYDNLANERPSQLSVFLGKEKIPSTLKNVDNSTCVRVLVSIPIAGIHRLRIWEKHTELEATTNPILCGSGTRRFWGMIHGHTEMSDGTGTLDQYFHQLRNEAPLDFAAPGDHDHLWETSEAFWKTTCSAVRRWHLPGRFVTFLGYEWAKWRQNGDGDRNVYYLGDDRPMYRSDDGEYPSPSDLFGALGRNRETAIVIPHHTGHGGNFCDWKDHDSTYERLVEIFQVRGSYECSEADGNPIPQPQKTAVPPYPRGYARDALAFGWRVGFTAGGDDHAGHWGTEARIGLYKQGLTCVESHDLSRESVFNALYERRVVATTGARMLLTYRLNDNPMGSELSLKAIPELAACRRLTIDFHGTGTADRVDVIRNGTVVHSVPASGKWDINISWDDSEPIKDIWLPAAKFCSHPFAYYYVRVVQQDGEVAWASPVWIDP